MADVRVTIERADAAMNATMWRSLWRTLAWVANFFLVWLEATLVALEGAWTIRDAVRGDGTGMALHAAVAGLCAVMFVVYIRDLKW